MDCSCNVGPSLDFGDECYQSWEQIMVRDNQDHKCHECDNTIKAGTEYFNHRCYTGTGRKDEYQICIDCQSIIDNMCSDHRYGTLFDDIEEYIETTIADSDDGDGENLPWSCIAKLTPGARDLVCDIIEKYLLEGDDDDGWLDT